MANGVDKCTRVTRDVQKLGMFWGVDGLKKKKFIKPSSSNPKMCVLTAKGRKELSKKRKEFPRIYGSLK